VTFRRNALGRQALVKPCFFRLQGGRQVTTLARSVNGAPGLKSRIQMVRESIDRAAARSGRGGGEVTLVAVVKTVPAEVVREALALGLTDLGENRVQEAGAHVEALGRGAARWHMIGHLQRNKAARAVELFDRVQSVDGVEVARALARHAAAAGRTLRALIEVNVGGEASKFGVAPAGLEGLLEQVLALPGLAIDGLMTVAPLTERPADARPHFARLRALRDAAAKSLGRALPELSMGMSADFEVAVEEGATIVRVGTALFGARS
jgi:pyridoxal phosphate enzyme (YggS family)